MHLRKGVGLISAIRGDFVAHGASARNSWVRPIISLTSLGFYVCLLHRLSAYVDSLGAVGRGISRVVDLGTNILSGCYINPEACICEGLFLPHPTGIVIGKGVMIGKNAKIFQNVTLGSSDISANAYPIIGERVTIFASAVVIGSVKVGNDATIGASSVVLYDVPEHGRVAGNPARQILSKS